MRTFLYVDDAAIFVTPTTQDVDHLVAILCSFGEVTRLATNFQKSSVIPIRCGHLNLDKILGGLSAMRHPSL